jgi:hypothetical protein
MLKIGENKLPVPLVQTCASFVVLAEISCFIFIPEQAATFTVYNAN